MPESWDLIVIGGGPGGHAAAEEAARCGARVAILERNQWGGTCTHRGCIPTKALLTCSRYFASFRKMKRLGTDTGPAVYDFAAMKRHQQQMVRLSALGVEKSLRDAGVHMMPGEGKILSPQRVACTDAAGNVETLQGRHIVIAWGSGPALLPGIEISDRILTSDGFLKLDALPANVLIVGGSVIGVEFATFLAELGVKVTLVEMLAQILPYEDHDTAAVLRQELLRLGVVIHTSAQLRAVAQQAGGVRATVYSRGQDLELAADIALICVGRRPLLDPVQLDQNGIRYDRGGIRVDERQRTSVQDIYAVGDVTGGAMLAHRAMQQGRALAGALFGDGSRTYSEAAVPSVVYSHPQVAHVGLTEQQARDQGMAVEVVRSDYAANIIARSELAGTGFVKMLFQKDRLVGAAVVGDSASELIAPLGLAVANGLGKRELKKWIIPHPTLSELMMA